MVTEYVLGFCFSTDYSNHRRVLLIRKSQPEWQAGKLNGLGGKVEPHDKSVFHAMQREFRAEAGLDTYPAGWIRFAILRYPHAIIHCFVNRLEWNIFKHAHRTCNEGEIVSFQHDEQFYEKMSEQRVLPDLHFLIPMAHAAYYQHPSEVIDISESSVSSNCDVANVTFASLNQDIRASLPFAS